MTGKAQQAFAAVSRLSQYRPFEGGGASAREAIDDLILASLAEAGGKASSISDIVETAKTLFTVDLHEAEVARSLGDLEGAKTVERSDGYFSLAPFERKRLDAVATESAKVSEEAMADWRAFLVDRWPNLSPVELGQLEGDLHTFLRQVLYRQGAEAAVLLYPDLPKAQELYDELEEMGLDFLPKAEGQVRAIRSAALSHFIRRPSESQRLWLGQQLNTTYFWRMLSIDPEGARLVRELATGQRVYLDTNVIYRLLGVQGPRYVRPAETIVKTTQEVGYETCVTPWTVREFRNSLKRAAEFVKMYPLPSSEYADLLAEATSDDDFVTAYWRHVKEESGLRLEDFVARFEEVEASLEQFGVTVRGDGCTAVEQRKDEIADEVAVLSKVLHGRSRYPGPIEHDVKHRLLIRQLRGSGDRRFANAGFWFLTFDSVLPRYDAYARREDGTTLSFCVSGGSWFQIVEALRPKSEDDLQLLADLLASPYVRYRRELSKETAQAIAARVQLHKGGDPKLAARIMMNSAFASEIEQVDGDAQVEKIDNAIVTAARQVQEAARRAQEEADAARLEAAAEKENAREQIQAADNLHTAELRDRDERIEKARREAEEAGERRLREEEDRTAKAVKAKEEQTAAARSDADKARREAERQSRRVRALGALFMIFIASLVGMLALGISGFWAVVVVVATVIGLWAAVDQLWIKRA
ncbi:MAG: hypothetical protein JSS97_04025 [Actinobacteria bacterium]|nr:hypothetical protein [Actinomycetota bacterium]